MQLVLREDPPEAETLPGEASPVQTRDVPETLPHPCVLSDTNEDAGSRGMSRRTRRGEACHCSGLKLSNFGSELQDTRV